MEEDQNTAKSPKDAKVESSKEVNESISQEQIIAQPETTDQKLETENMEVHHHPNLHHRKKHWKEYFLEFLMIFLAVTLGFFAENLREHFSDKNKEKDYMQNLLDDLSKDTTHINNSINGVIYDQHGRDTLSILLYSYQPGKTDVREITRLFIMYCFDYNIVRLTDHTITELKTSGNMRLIKNRLLANSILSYDDRAHFTEKQGDVTFDLGEKNMLYGNEIINVQQLTGFIKEGASVFSDSVYAIKNFTNVSGLNPDTKLLFHFANSMTVYIAVCNDYINQLNETKKETINLISLIKKEYNL